MALYNTQYLKVKPDPAAVHVGGFDNTSLYIPADCDDDTIAHVPPPEVYPPDVGSSAISDSIVCDVLGAVFVSAIFQTSEPELIPSHKALAPELYLLNIAIFRRA